MGEAQPVEWHGEKNIAAGGGVAGGPAVTIWAGDLVELEKLSRLGDRSCSSLNLTQFHLGFYGAPRNILSHWDFPIWSLGPLVGWLLALAPGGRVVVVVGWKRWRFGGRGWLGVL